MKNLIRKILREELDFGFIDSIGDTPSFDELELGDGKTFLMQFGPHPLPYISNKKLRIKYNGEFFETEEIPPTKRFNVQSLDGGKWVCCFEITRDEWSKFFNDGLLEVESLNEGMGLSFTDDIEYELSPEGLSVGDLFLTKWRGYNRVLKYMGRNTEDIKYEVPLTSFVFRMVYDESMYSPYPSQPKEHPLNSEITFNTFEVVRKLDDGSLKPITNLDGFDDTDFMVGDHEGDYYKYNELNEDEQYLSEPYIYYVDDSDIHGKGVFASQDIQAGTMIGLLHTIFDDGYEFEELGKLHNHSDEPNCFNELIDNQRFLVAMIDIPMGTELTSDYTLQPDLEQPLQGWI